MYSKGVILLGLTSASFRDEQYPSYNVCRVFNPFEYETVLPDMGLANVWPGLPPREGDYVEKGKVVTLSGLDMYVVGSGETAIIWNYDVYGFEAGRTREYWSVFDFESYDKVKDSDFFAEAGFLVILPDFFRGDSFPEKPIDMGKFSCKYTQWDNLRFDLEEIVLPFARLNGASSFGTVGTCWGGYNIIRLAGYQKCNFAIGFHASGYNMLRNLYGEDYIAIFNNVTTDVLYLNSQAEPPENREGGLQLGLSIFFEIN